MKRPASLSDTDASLNEEETGVSSAMTVDSTFTTHPVVLLFWFFTGHVHCHPSTCCRPKKRKKAKQLHKVSSPCMDDHQFKLEELESVGELSEVCSRIFLKCLYLAWIGKPCILWSVNKLARSVTKWAQACDRRLARLISYIHHANDFRQYCHVGNTAQNFRSGLFQDSDFAGNFEDSKSTSGGVLCIFWK